MDYKPEKLEWREQDFSEMGWHDNSIYKIHVSKDLELDIDYIFKWNKPELDGLPFTFWVAPATLVFEDINNLIFEVASDNDNIEIADIEREELMDSFRWKIVLRNGYFQFDSKSFKQYIRQSPSFQFTQSIPLTERGGLSLERTINQNNPAKDEERVLQRRQQDLEDYRIAKARHFQIQELEKISSMKEKKSIDLKEYLLKKRELEETIVACNNKLRNTVFESYSV